MQPITTLSRILILGKDGQLGRALQQEFSPSRYPNITLWGRQQLDLANLAQLEAALETHRPDLIINASAYTAVDAAETDVDLAYRINCIAVGALARYCANYHVPLIHYSTDYVFDGQQPWPYQETDVCVPQNIYGMSKRDGELAILEMYREAFFPYWIFRTSWVYGQTDGLQGNFIKTMMRLAFEKEELRVVADQVGVPTAASWLAGLTLEVVQTPIPEGIYHAVPQGQTSWHGLASHIMTELKAHDLSIRVQAIHPIHTKDYPLPAIRPSNGVLAHQKLKQCLPQIAWHQWQMQVNAYINAYVKNQRVGRSLR